MVLSYITRQSFMPDQAYTVFLLQYIVYKTKKKSKEVIAIKCRRVVTLRKTSAGVGGVTHRASRALFIFSCVIAINMWVCFVLFIH